MVKKGEIIGIRFSEKYKWYRNLLKFIPVIIIPLFTVIFLQLVKATLISYLIFLSLAYIISFFIFLRLQSANEILPNKIQIVNDGICVWRRNKKKEFIHWNRISRIINDDPGASDIFFIRRKDEKMYSLIPWQLPIPAEVAHIVIKKFNIYKKKNDVK